MKVLLAHNFYGSSAPSGENRVYLAERDLLRDRGHEVLEFTRHSDAIRNRGALGLLRGALGTPWNPFAVANLRRLLARERPDILHVHNTFPLLSPAVFHAAHGLGTATVLTLHNYRTFCAAGIPLRDGRPCKDCLDSRSVLPALRYGCYRDSRWATFPMALMIALHRQIGTWTRHVDAFIALTEFQQEALARAGLPKERLHVKPHFYADAPEPLPWERRTPKVLCVGRLGREKGVHILLEAWKTWGGEAPILEIIGDGPERVSLENLIQSSRIGDRVVFTGSLPFVETQRRLAEASLLVFPSLCFEGLPMVLQEAFALGVPVCTSRLGSMPCIVNDGRDGLLFEPGNPSDLLGRVRDLWGHPDRLAAMARAARRTFEGEYTSEANYPLLIEIYGKAKRRRSACEK